jgi:hypothetical protein
VQGFSLFLSSDSAKLSPIEAGVVSRMEMLPVGGNFEGDEMGSKKDLMVWGDFSMMTGIDFQPAQYWKEVKRKLKFAVFT